MNTMVGCNKARKMIDEADHPEALSFEASSHAASCPDCGSFAEDRARLRSLLAAGSRVGVPMNFDAVLKARIADAKRRSAFAWLNPAGYLKLGAATAGLVVMVFAAQQGGLFRSDDRSGQLSTSVDAVKPPVPQPAPLQPSESRIVAGSLSVVAPAVINRPHHPSRRIRGLERTANPGVPLEISSEEYLESGGVVLVRGSNGEADISLPMVSVGAQSLVYASAGASRRTVRTLGTSF